MDIRAKKKSKLRKRMLAKTLIIGNFSFFLIWLLAHNIDVYEYAVVGAVFELIWLPLLLGMIVSPIISFYFWWKDSFKRKSNFAFALVLSILILLIILLAP